MTRWPSIEQLLVLRARLQELEDALVTEGRRNVAITCAGGILTWVRRGAERRPTEQAVLENVQEVGRMIVSQGHNRVLPMTKGGTFTWWPRQAEKSLAIETTSKKRRPASRPRLDATIREENRRDETDNSVEADGSRSFH